MLQLTDIFATLGQYKITHFLIEKNMGKQEIYFMAPYALCVVYTHLRYSIGLDKKALMYIRKHYDNIPYYSAY